MLRFPRHKSLSSNPSGYFSDTSLYERNLHFWPYHIYQVQFTFAKIPVIVKYVPGFCGRTPDFRNLLTGKGSISRVPLMASSSSLPSLNACFCTLEDGRDSEGLWFSKPEPRKLPSGLHTDCWKKWHVPATARQACPCPTCRAGDNVSIHKDEDMHLS